MSAAASRRAGARAYNVTSMEQIGIYVRISDDPDGTQTATERQLEDCSRFAASRSWNVADVFEDIDISAYQRNAKRPEFERMIAAVRDKRIDGVLAWKMDRLSRRMRDFVRLDEQCEESGAFVASVIEGIDTRLPTGRFVAELLTAQARMESANTSTRVTRAHEQMAKNGQPVLGGLRPFGYSKDRSEIIPHEAELIRDAVSRVIAGESIRSICKDWHAGGVLSGAGKPWKTASLSRLLGSAFISGQRDLHGVLTPGQWSAIISPAETVTLRHILADPQRRTRGSWARTYLLTGMIRCGLCGELLIARPRADHVRRYVCAKDPGTANCGRLARVAGPIEELIRESVIAALDGADLTQYLYRQAEGDEGAIIEELRRDEEQLVQNARDQAAGAISRTEFFAARDVLQDRLTRNRARLGNHRQFDVLASVVSAGTKIREQWDARPLEWRRALIAAVIDHVVLHPVAKRGQTAFDPSLVEPIWRA